MVDLSFKEKSLLKLFDSANSYNKLLNVEIVIKIEIKKAIKLYNIRFFKSNFLHLTGVFTNLTSINFYHKCLNKTLCISDFKCDTSKWLKELVKKKLKHLVNIDNFFNSDLLLQENFQKGKVNCLIATTDGKCTIGFAESENYLRPKTLLNKNKLNYKKPIYKVKAEIHDITI